MWCSSAVNRTSLPATLAARAASRTPSSPINARGQLCVRGAGGAWVFLLAARLPSSPSACADLEAALLFGSFIGTTQASDFSPALMSGVRPRAFPDPPAANFAAGADEISQFLFGEFLRMLRAFDRVWLAEDSRVASSSMWPSASLNSVGAPDCLIPRLNGWPALSPVNASTTPSRAPPHDSGPGWFANPFLCRTFIN
jgi:hypothetical protein